MADDYPRCPDCGGIYEPMGSHKQSPCGKSKTSIEMSDKDVQEAMGKLRNHLASANSILDKFAEFGYDVKTYAGVDDKHFSVEITRIRREEYKA